MKLLVGRLVLGCMLSVLVLADKPVVEMVTEKLAVVPAVVVSNSTTVAPEVPELSIKGKIFAKPTSLDSQKKPQHEIIVIPDHGHRPNHGHHDHDHDHDDHHHHHDNDNHHHHHDNDNHHHHHDNDNHHHHHDNDHHHHHHEDDHHHNHHTSPHRPPIHPLPPSHHHHHPMSPYNPYYPPYYPPPPPPYHYNGHHMYAPVPQIPHPYPYYPPSYYSDPVKPITVIHSNDNNGHGHGNDNTGTGRPTDLLWNLIDHKNNELWNLFGGKHGDNDKGDGAGGVHEIVVINAKPGFGNSGIAHGSNSGWGIKGKNFADNDCNEKH